MPSLIAPPSPNTAASVMHACISPTVTAVLGAVVLILTQSMTITTTIGGTELGPKWWPTIIASLIVLFSLIAIALAALGKPIPSDQASSTSLGKASLLSTIALLLAFIMLWPLVGFFPSAAGFLVLLAIVLGERSLPKIAAFTAITTGVLYVLFALLLRIPL